MAQANTGAEDIDFIAQEAGFFKKHGVNVKFQSDLAANVATEVAAKRVDIGTYGTGVPLGVDTKGTEVPVIYGLTGGGFAGVMVGSSKVDTIDKLKAKTGKCRIGTFPAGSAAYGYAALYNQQLGLKCDIVPLPDGTSQVGALAAGRIDALVGIYPTVEQALAQGKAKMLIDTRQQDQSQQYIGDPYPEVVLFGRSDVLSQKKAAVVAYLKAIDDAVKYTNEQPVDEIVKLMKKNRQLDALTPAQVKTEVENLKTFRWRGSSNGYISQDQWNLALQRISQWGIQGYDAKAPQITYDEAVDMSYYEAALGKPAG